MRSGTAGTRLACRLGRLATEFAGQIATAVWLGELSDTAAREALRSFAMARRGLARGGPGEMIDALVSEYERRRVRQDACS